MRQPPAPPAPPGDPVVHMGFVFPPGTDIQRDVLDAVENPSGRPVLPIGKTPEADAIRARHERLSARLAAARGKRS